MSLDLLPVCMLDLNLCKTALDVKNRFRVPVYRPRGGVASNCWSAGSCHDRDRTVYNYGTGIKLQGTVNLPHEWCRRSSR